MTFFLLYILLISNVGKIKNYNYQMTIINLFVANPIQSYPMLLLLLILIILNTYQLLYKKNKNNTTNKK